MAIALGVATAADIPLPGIGQLRGGADWNEGLYWVFSLGVPPGTGPAADIRPPRKALPPFAAEVEAELRH